MIMPTDVYGAYPLRGRTFLQGNSEVLSLNQCRVYVPYRPAYFVINIDSSDGLGEYLEVDVYMYTF